MTDVYAWGTFEEMLKQTSENKINTANSWNSGLIDFFHDMRVLRDGNTVDFKKASNTLEGCVKVYTHRVDSVAEETGKLLNGLAESKNKKSRGRAAAEEDEEGDGEEDEEGEDGQKKKRKKAPRPDANLSTHEQLQNKKMDIELSMDPMFKKASADFDEGGVKGLLLNNLFLDSKGRIVFDSSDDAEDITVEHKMTPAPDDGAEEDHDDSTPEAEASEDVEIDISSLAAKYFDLPSFAQLDHQEICPSSTRLHLNDIFTGSLDLADFTIPEDLGPDVSDGDGDDDQVAINGSGDLPEDNYMAFNDDDDDMTAIAQPPEAGFGEGGEAWAREAALEPQARVHQMTPEVGDEDRREESAEDGVAGAEDYDYKVSAAHGPEQENMFHYFDQAFKKNWAGPEHWRVARIKGMGKAAPARERKEKVPFVVDFLAPMSQSLNEALFGPKPAPSTIQAPKSQLQSKARNLLPDDKHFNSNSLRYYYLVPDVRIGEERLISEKKIGSGRGDREDDEAYWANQARDEKPDYDANFYQDDGIGNDDAGDDDEEAEYFADAREQLSPPLEEAPNHLQGLASGIFSTQEGEPQGDAPHVVLPNMPVPQAVPYARKAKKVDVHRLKNEIWDGLGFEETQQTVPTSDSGEPGSSNTMDVSVKFTDVIVNTLPKRYAKQQLDDLSTAYCFICLLHLANEKGLVIENEENFEDLTVRRDPTADLSVGVLDA
ncbi:barren [Westerdykella ornata]|uniref:Condensin complex subunit 2 n=1 Tax=Westerdykella ornata TaxID=318751 RepID=A0A6A6JWB6_WESOR|nr:barren [Westerdykella ornata]KAF2280910.1 barren [Westerdykella ornata]